MSIISAIIQGLIQGFTEFLPVSSSGHLSLFQYFTGVNSEASVAFSIMLHFGTLVAVVIAFWHTIWELIKEFFALLGDLFTGKLLKKKANSKRRMIYFLMLSCVPLLGVLFVKDLISSFSSDNSIILEGACFLITALLLTAADRVVKGQKTAKSMTATDATVIGVAQLCATLPGISRSGSTISAGLLMGLDRSYAVAYSFILGLPAILAAGLLDLKDIMATGKLGLPLHIALIGMVVAAVAGLFSIQLVRYIVKSDKFKIFAWYTLLLGLVILSIGISEEFTSHAVQRFIISLLAK